MSILQSTVAPTSHPLATPHAPAESNFRSVLSNRLVLLLASLSIYSVIHLAWGEGTPIDRQSKFFEALLDLDVARIKSALNEGMSADRSKFGKGTLIPLQLVIYGFSRSTTQPRLSPSEREDLAISAIDILVAAGAKLRPNEVGLVDVVETGSKKVAMHLIRLGVGADWRGESKYTPAEKAQLLGKKEFYDLLIANGATPPDVKEMQQEMFVKAAGEGDLAKIQDLLVKGAAIDGQNKDGESALGRAILMTDTDLANLLIAKGANVSAVSKTLAGNQAPLIHQAVSIASFRELRAKKFSDEQHRLKAAFSMITTLLENGAKISCVDDSDGDTPLHVAARFNAVETAKALIDANAKVMPRNKLGQTPLDVATDGKMIELLREHGAVER